MPRTVADQDRRPGNRLSGVLDANHATDSYRLFQKDLGASRLARADLKCLGKSRSDREGLVQSGPNVEPAGRDRWDDERAVGLGDDRCRSFNPSQPNREVGRGSRDSRR